MNVKILSMQRVVNYGSFMQAYALKKVVETAGHTVAFCDFNAGAARHLGVKVKKVTIWHKIFNLRKLLFKPNSYLAYRHFRQQLCQCYTQHAWPALGITAEKNLDYSGDLMIIGSDEVFNYTQNHAFGYVPALFGLGVTTSSIISYAASAGYANASDVESDGMQDEMIKGFAQFDAIGVRDQNTFELASRYAKQAVHYTIDPTLLVDFSQETPDAHIPPNYLLVYAYGGRIDAAIDVKKITEYAKSKNLRVISVGFYNDWCDENMVVKPFDLLAVFKHASYVITDTFHGTIFSIKYCKPFVSIIQGENKWGSNASKVGFLLKQLNLSPRIINNSDNLASDLETPIDYVAVNHTLAILRDQSLQFLHGALHKAEIKAQAFNVSNLAERLKDQDLIQYSEQHLKQASVKKS